MPGPCHYILSCSSSHAQEGHLDKGCLLRSLKDMGSEMLPFLLHLTTLSLTETRQYSTLSYEGYSRAGSQMDCDMCHLLISQPHLMFGLGVFVN
ncbi:hypothetical protein JTE90_007928 [Oedothorax gibbosus]|uniref:Uncharacterized protein n=1 Tax=Oedothorax gibbosus TaxID=931172 RepID=A0AAV6VHE9_9ARAC|nr:hypothetical protein JTE90_007928 [Oedothorax gibbosus]